MKSLILLAPFLFLSAVPAFADGLIRADFGYVMDENKTGGADSKDTRQFIDLTAGKIWSSRLTLFGQYALETDSLAGVSGNRSSWGPGVGWVTKQDVGPYILGTYYIQSTYTGSGNSYTGWGYQFDLGLRVAISSLYLIAGLSYEYFEYTKNNGTTLPTPNQEDHINPRVGFMFEF